MSDDGKVMIGTDGNPLLSPDGKVVLSDQIFPFFIANASASGDNKYWLRELNRWPESYEPYFENPIDNANWVEFAGIYSTLYCDYIKERQYPNSNFDPPKARCRWDGAQTVIKVDGWDHVAEFSEIPIMWNRINKIQYDYSIYARGNNWYGQPPVTFNLMIGLDGCTEPYGNNRPWEGEGWALLDSVSTANATNGDVLKTGTIELDKEETIRYFALYADDISENGSGDYPYRIAGQSVGLAMPPKARIVYNLAD